MQATYVWLGLALAFTAAQRPSAGIEPGIFKMNPVGGGGALPSEGPVITVRYDRVQRRYVSIDQEPLTLRLRLSASCGPIKFRELNLRVLGKTIPVDTSKLSVSDGWFSGQTTVTTSELTTGALADVVPDPVATCNADLKSLVGQDEHGKAQKGWARQYDNTLPVELSVFCLDEGKKKLGFEDPPHSNPTDKARSPVWLHCGPAAVHRIEGPSEGPSAKKSGLQSVRVFVNPEANADYKGPCPKALAFGGEVQYLRAPGPDAVTLRYRYRTHDGSVSPVMTTDITESGKKNISYWKREFGSTSGANTLAAPGGGGSRVINGWVQLEVLAPDGAVREEDRQSFKLTCEPQRVAAAGGISHGDIVLKEGITANMQLGALPDLIVRAAQPAPATPSALRVEVANVGAGPSGAAELAVFYHRSGQVVKHTFDVPALQPGQSRWIVADVRSPLAHAERVTVRVNDSGRIKESNGTNNVFTVK